MNLHADLTSKRFLSFAAVSILVGSAFLLLLPTIPSTAATTSRLSVTCDHKSEPQSHPIVCTAKVTGHSPTGKVIWNQTGGTGAVVFDMLRIPPPLNKTVYGTCVLTGVPIVSSGSSCSTLLMGTKTGTITLVAAYQGDTNNLPSKGSSHITIGSQTSFTHLEYYCSGSTCPPTSTSHFYIGDVTVEEPFSIDLVLQLANPRDNWCVSDTNVQAGFYYLYFIGGTSICGAQYHATILPCPPGILGCGTIFEYTFMAHNTAPHATYLDAITIANGDGGQLTFDVSVTS